MYDSSKEQILHWYGEDEFTFAPKDDNVNIFTRIPKFWYRRYKEGEDEYWKIATYPEENFIEFKGVSPARYDISGNTLAPRSIANGAIINNTSGDDFRTCSKNLGIFNGLLDIWTVGAIWMLYLIEYADFDSQTTLGQGVVGTDAPIKSGGCDSLGMHSGCVKNDGTTSSVIYRGIEDIYGNEYQLVDGLNLNNYKIFICQDWSKYNFTTTEDYVLINFEAAQTNGYITKLGLDENYPLVIFPIEADTVENAVIPDYYNRPGTTEKAFRLGGCFAGTSTAGLFDAGCAGPASGASDIRSARFLLHRIK